MKRPHFVRTVLCALFAPLAIHAQTWVGGNNSNTSNTANNWSPSGIPASNGDLIFGTSGGTNTSVTFNASYTANSLTFSNNGTQTYSLGAANSAILTIGVGGLTANAGSAGVNFNSQLNLTLGASQTWSVSSNVSVSSPISGIGFSINKTGTGNLTLSGNNTYSGGTTISAGKLYLGQSASAGTGAINVTSAGTLGVANSDITISNALSLGDGATLGGSVGSSSKGQLELSGTASVGSGATTLNIAGSEVVFKGDLAAASAGANLTMAGTGMGIAVLGGNVTNIVTMVASNAGIGFTKTSQLPASLQVTNGGYVSIADVGNGTTPALSSLLGSISTPNKLTFNGTIGFDTSDDVSVPHTFSDAIDLSGFTAGNVSLSSSTGAILTGTITLPSAATSYDFKGFGGQGGILVVKSDLANNGATTTGITVTSPNSNGVGNGGMGLILQGNNTFTGNLSVLQSGAVLDSANALPSLGNFSVGNSTTGGYVGYTETANYTSFADFKNHLQGTYNATSVLGLDSHDIITDMITTGNVTSPVRSVNDPINLSSLGPITLGTVTGVTITNCSTITAPSDSVLRLVNFSDNGGAFTINPTLGSSGNVTSLVVGMTGADGSVVLNGVNTFSGGTTLQGGSALAGPNSVSGGVSSAFGSGSITVTSTSAFGSGNDAATIGASSGSITLNNNIAVTNFLTVGTGKFDDNGNYTVGTTSLALNGIISNNTTSGRLYITGPTTLGGANTYTGGTYVLANTTVTNDSGLGTFFVDVGYNANLTFTSTHPTIGVLADAGNFIGNAGTGNVILSGPTELTINGTSSGIFSGNISGTGGITINKTGTAAQTFNGTNSFTGVVTLSGGTLFVSSISNGGSNSALGAASNAASNIIFNGGTLQYTGGTASTDRNFTINTGKTATVAVGNTVAVLTIAGASTSTNGAFIKSGSGSLVLSGNNLHTGTTTVSQGKLFVDGSLAGAASVSSGATLGGIGTLGGGATILSGGRLAPGTASGSGVGTLTFSNGLTLNSGANFDFQLGTSSDKIFVTGGTLAGPASGTMTLNLSNSGGFAAGTYTLFDYTGSLTPVSFDATDFVFGTTIGGFSNSLAISGTTLVLTATAIPEPATYAALFGFVALGAVVWRRRRVEVSRQ